MADGERDGAAGAERGRYSLAPAAPSLSLGDGLRERIHAALGKVLFQKNFTQILQNPNKRFYIPPLQ